MFEPQDFIQKVLATDRSGSYSSYDSTTKKLGIAMGNNGTVFNNFKENTQYTIILKYDVTDSAFTNLRIDYTDGSNTSILVPTTSAITTPTNIYKILTNVSKSVESLVHNAYGGVKYIYPYECGIVEGDINIENFVEHEEQNYPFTFAEGQRFSKYEKLTDNGKEEIWEEYIFTGEENWSNYQDTQSGDYYRYYSIDAKLGRTNYFEEEAFCTHFRNNNFKKDSQGIGLTKYGTYISIDKTIASSTEELKQWFATQYNNGNPIKVQFIKSKPTIIPYNETQQEQFERIKQAKSYTDTTIITSESEELASILDVIAYKELPQMKTFI